MTASEIIDQLGGTAEVARLCEVEQPSVSEWRKRGIPRARLMFLKLARPDVFGFPVRTGDDEDSDSPAVGDVTNPGQGAPGDRGD